jgi:AraC-like DNA-binding protein
MPCIIIKPIKQRNTKNNILIDLYINEINKFYNRGLSLTKISEKFGISRKSLTRLFKKNGVSSRKGFHYARKYNLNEHYLDVINTEEKAYMLGFIYADGNNLFKLNRISIHLSKKDEEILRKFSRILYNGDEIIKYTKIKNNKGKEFVYAWLNIYSKHMSKHIASLGVIERKSHKLVFPDWLDKSLYRHFIRGLIDGDGWIYIPHSNRDSPNVGLICTRQVNDTLKNIFEKELNLKSYIVKAYKQDINIMCEIRIKNYHQCKIFLDWIYNNATIYLERKYDLYKKFLNIWENLRKQNK